LVVDLVRDGHVVRTIRFEQAVPADSYGRPVTMLSGVGLPEFHTNQFDPSDAHRWSIRIRGDAEASVREFDCDRYWSGTFSVPLEKALIR
jgi:hypothetical protein